ncbi:MAG: extracellular solute-binding protein, partial [Oscillospiraceae bacterium]|jgi:raffinose/stachyose/melibiose transport system substrate-binding protein|nr:extracellular solute-binding protein [Oscillospiraceae bacterium]
VPTTIAELEAVADALVEAGYTPFSLANGSKWTGSMWFMYLATRFGGTDAFAAAVSGEGAFTSEAFMYAAETIQKWVEKGYFPEGVNSLSTDDGQDRALMYQEQAVFMLHGSWQARDMQNDDPDWYKANIDYMAFPALEGSEYPQNIVVGTSIGNGFSFNIHNDPEKLKAAVVLATSFYSDAEYSAQQMAANTIPSIVGMGDTTEDQCMAKIWADFSAAPEVQLWYDQYLPPAVSEAHKDLTQEIFGLTMTPQEANQALDDAMAAYRAQ